jgi:murein DD-endopeptidase MepM/ murein hydrolase activator NlpD
MKISVVVLAFVLSVSGCKTYVSKLNSSSTASAANTATYQREVKTGDTLNTIAKEFDSNWRSIYQLNSKTLKDGLRVGQILTIAPGPRANLVVGSPSKQIPFFSEDDNSQEELDQDGTLLSDAEDIEYKPKSGGIVFDPKKSKANTGFIFPVGGRITSKFGPRRGRMHQGIDIAAMIGTPLKSSADGEVIFSGKRKGYGGTVVVDHGRYMTLYAHCSSMIGKVGDKVYQGEVVAKSGRTGNARGAHLHFEIRNERNRPLDPLTLLKGRPVAGLEGFGFPIALATYGITEPFLKLPM